MRQEYIYRKSVDKKKRETLEKKKKIKDAIKEGKAIPTELRIDELALR